MNNTTNTTTLKQKINKIKLDINNNIFEALMFLNFRIIYTNIYESNINNYKNTKFNNYNYKKNKKNKWNKRFKYQYKNQLTQPRHRGTNH